MIRVLIVDDSPTMRATLEQALKAGKEFEVVGSLETGEEALAQIVHLEPDIVLMDVIMPGMSGIEATKKLAEIHPSPVIIMSTRSERELLQQAMQAGASEYLIKPFEPKEVCDAVRRVHALNIRRVLQAKEDLSLTAAYAPEIFSIFSAKGGSGRSLIAVNLATAIGAITQAPVALLDLDLLFGDVAMLLNLEATRTISSVVGNATIGDALTETMQQGPPNVMVLPSPTQPELAETIDAAFVSKIIAELRANFSFIVIDLPTNFSEVNFAAMDESTKVVMITTPTTLAIVDTTTALNTFQALEIPGEQIEIVLNHIEDRASLSRADIEDSLDHKLTIEIPYDRKTVAAAMDAGKPFVSTAPQEEISRRIRDLVGKLVPAERRVASKQNGSVPGRRRRLFARH